MAFKWSLTHEFRAAPSFETSNSTHPCCGAILLMLLSSFWRALFAGLLWCRQLLAVARKTARTQYHSGRDKRTTHVINGTEAGLMCAQFVELFQYDTGDKSALQWPKFGSHWVRRPRRGALLAGSGCYFCGSAVWRRAGIYLYTGRTPAVCQRRTCARCPAPLAAGRPWR